MKVYAFLVRLGKKTMTLKARDVSRAAALIQILNELGVSVLNRADFEIAAQG